MSAATDLAERWAEAFRNGDAKAFASCFAEHAIQQHPFFPSRATSREEILAREAPLFEAFSDIKLDVVDVIEDRDRAVIEGVVTATNTGDLPTPSGVLAATGKTIVLPLVSVVRLDAGGLVVEEHRYLDAAGFMAQLGVGR